MAYASYKALTGQAEVIRALGMRKTRSDRQIAERSAAMQQKDAHFNNGRYASAVQPLRLVTQSLAPGLAARLAGKG